MIPVLMPRGVLPLTRSLGDAARSIGPDAVQLGTDAPTLTGHFFVYDADFVDTTTPGTLLGTSQEVTVSPGDIWEMAKA